MKIIRTKAKNPLAEDFAKPYSIKEEIDFRKLIVVEELLQFMKREGIKRTELADRMGVPPSRITKMLSGDSNLTIDTLVRAGRAVGADLHQTFAPAGSKVRWTSYDPADVHEAFAAPVRTTVVENLNTPFYLNAPTPDDKAPAA
jgi:transcriptional regulator with XRE-family HTH domain